MTVFVSIMASATIFGLWQKNIMAGIWLYLFLNAIFEIFKQNVTK